MDAGKDTIWFTIPLRGVGCYDIKAGHYTIFPNKDQSTGKISDVDISFFQRKNGTIEEPKRIEVRLMHFRRKTLFDFYYSMYI